MLIGIFDSGLGGLSVLREIRQQLPQHDLLYLADSAYCPYGPRPAAEIRARALACATFLVEQAVELIVVACNTATSAAAAYLREQLAVPIVAMEPGVKPAVHASRARRIGVLATESTLDSERFATLVERFAWGTTVVNVPAPGLVELVEAGDLVSSQARTVVEGYLAPLRAAGVDVIVLGCTHFAFLRPLIAERVGPAITLIDTGPAVAAQTARMVTEHRMRTSRGRLHFFTTGKAEMVEASLHRVWGEEVVLLEAKI